MKAFWKLSPVLVLAGLMMISNIKSLSTFFGFSLDILIIAPIAVIYAAIVAMITEKFKFNDILNSAVDNVKEMQLVFFILMFAYAMADVFMGTGVGASIISLSLSVGISAQTVALVAFLVSSVLSVATGTSWGTFAACAPIFLWMTHILGGDIVLSLAAIAGGSCFGDNLGLISDTTVVSSGIHNVEVTHRMRNQGLWSLFCLIVAGALFYAAGISLPGEAVDPTKAIEAIPQDVWTTLGKEKPVAVDLLKQVQHGVPLYMVIPLILVIVIALKGFSTLLCLGAGIVSCYILGTFAGTVEGIIPFLEMIKHGFIGAGSWVIIMMMWVAAFGGIMAKMDAFRPLSILAVKLSRNVRQLMFWNGIISLLGNAALADEMAQIVTVGPIIKDITEENVEGSEEDMYTLRLRNASFSSALGIFGSQLIPWHVYLSFFVGIASTVYPLHAFSQIEIIEYNFMSYVAVFSILLFTLFGVDRFIPGFAISREPNVKLKKSIA
ncbi:MAG: sodium:proton antiporter [Candidatus Cloacimonadota bacterium]|nr:MAG: sodium:proton antiporter [Candidatus Cloacimonadota bacterium]PIE81251.1 MAG: sodium:proton antiporter [Candidatus Delongbacteria bacterium]